MVCGRSHAVKAILCTDWDLKKCIGSFQAYAGAQGRGKSPAPDLEIYEKNLGQNPRSRRRLLVATCAPAYDPN